MTDKMTVLFVKDTGQVVAALTRAADPEAKLTADLLVGDALVLRYIGDPTELGYGLTDFPIEPDELDVLTPDLETAVLSSPRSFFVDGDKKVQPTNSISGVTPNFPSTAQIQITAGVAVTQESKVRVEIVKLGTAERQVATAKIAAGETIVDVNLRPLEPAITYDVLTLVQGFEPDRRLIDTP